MRELTFINNYIYPYMDNEEKTTFLSGESYPDEDYICKLAKENNIKITK